jgi:hypothetical protein
LERTGQNVPGVTGNPSRPDLIDFRNLLLYEIKSRLDFSDGVKELDQYLRILNVHNMADNRPLWRAGSIFYYIPPSVIFAPPIGLVNVDPPKGGVITYEVDDQLNKILVVVTASSINSLIAADLLAQLSAGSLARAYGF